MAPPHVCIAYTEGGGGHRSVARALAQHLEATLGWRVTLVNPYRDMGSFVDVFRILTGHSVEDLYNRLLQHFVPTYVPYPFFHVWAFLIRLNKRIYGRRGKRKMASYWLRAAPDLVVSVMPWINDELAESLAAARPDAPFVTVMTDYDECARGMWVSSRLQMLICSSRRAAQRAARRGHPRDRILEASGIVISPAFHEPIPEDREVVRSRLGLAADVPAGLVMYGGQGASRMLQVARAMNRARYPVQLIFLCGHDRRTADAIRALSTRYPASVHGFVDDVHRYMAAADFFIGKPGPSSIAEALASGLPMVLDFDWRTMLQDRYNAAWAAESGVALLSRSMRELPDRIHVLLDDYALYRDAARAMSRGRALFDVAALLDGCLPRAGAGAQ